ncbi:MAG: hypothetical protein AAF581_03550 [Planctomycetota bacterium]
MKRWLFSYWPPLLLLIFASALLVYDLGIRHSFYASPDRVGHLGQWGESYRAAWTTPAPHTPPILAVDGDVVSREWDPRILNTIAAEEDVSWCGDVVVFASNRGDTQDFDLFWSRRVGTGFSLPVRFPDPINGAFNERSPSLARVGDEWLLLFTSNRTYGTIADHDLYLVRGVLGGDWEEVALISEVSSVADERSAALRPDGAGLYFTRPERGGIAIYESWKHPHGSWSDPVALTAFAHPHNEAFLCLHDSGDELFLQRGDSYVSSQLQLLRVLPKDAFGGPQWILLILALLLLALRALARRWPTLEIIYRCLLVSALIHLLLWLWLRDTEVESDLSPSVGPSDPTSAAIELTMELFETEDEPVEVSHGESIATAAATPAATAQWRRLEATWESLTATDAQLASAESVAAPTAEAAIENVHDRQQPTRERAVENLPQEVLQAIQQQRPQRTEATAAAAAPATRQQQEIVRAAPSTPAEPLPSPSPQEWQAQEVERAAPAVAASSADKIPAAIAQVLPPGRSTTQEAHEALMTSAPGDPHGSERAVTAQPGTAPTKLQRPQLPRGSDALRPEPVELTEVDAAPAAEARQPRSRVEPTTVSERAIAVPARAVEPTSAAATELVAAASTQEPVVSAREQARAPSRPQTHSASRPPTVQATRATSRDEIATPPPVELAAVPSKLPQVIQRRRSSTSLERARAVRRPQPTLARDNSREATVALSSTLQKETQQERTAEREKVLAPPRPSALTALRPATALRAATATAAAKVVKPAQTRKESAKPEAQHNDPLVASIVTTSADLQRAAPTRTSFRATPQSRVRRATTTATADGASAAVAATGPKERPLPAPPRAVVAASKPGLAQPRIMQPAPRARLRPSTPRLQGVKGGTTVAEVRRVARPVATPSVPWLSARFGSRKQEALRQFGGGEETERAVAKGLAYLASQQRRDGGWGAVGHEDQKYGQVVIGKSALVLLAFLGAGHYPTSGTEYEDVAAKAVEFLLAQQRPRTGHFGSMTSSYSHGITTYALAEACLLRPTDRLRRSLREAVRQILRNQISGSRDRRLDGGWSYYYHQGARSGITGYPRVSITAWQVMALKSARLAGIDVPQRALNSADSYLLGSWSDALGRFLYSLDEQRLRSRFPTLPGSTPAAAFVLQVMGRKPTEPILREAFRYLDAHRPDSWSEASAQRFVRGGGNPYYWYYGTLAMFLHGGPEWDRWNAALKDTLVPAQRSDGSWDPISIYATYATDSSESRSYTTALNVLMLEVYYRYLTPFQEAALGDGNK